jgi:hypothetical protein
VVQNRRIMPSSVLSPSALFCRLCQLWLAAGGGNLYPTQRKPYEPPKLTVFGNLKRLIQLPASPSPAGGGSFYDPTDFF